MSRTQLVLGPALGTSADALWGRCAALLEPVFDVVVWDLPGHGANRDAVADPALRIEQLAAGVLREVEGPFVYAGASVGGAVGLQLLLDAPERVTSAVLLCTGARLGEPQAWFDRAELVRTAGTAALREGAAQRWFAPGFVDRRPEVAAALVDHLVAADDAGYAAVCHALAHFDVRDRLGEIAVPVLAIGGRHDVATSTGLLEQIGSGVRHGRTVVLDDVAHLAPAEAPELVATLIADHALRPRRTRGGP